MRPLVFGATKEHLRSETFQERGVQQETKRTGVVDSSSERS